MLTPLKTLWVKSGETLTSLIEDESIEMILEPGSRAVVAQVHRDPAKALENRFVLKKDAQLDFVIFSSGAGAFSDRHAVVLEGERANASLKGLAILDGDASVTSRARLEHQRGFGKSRQVFKNILFGRSRSDFESLVHVHRGAQGSDSRQLNKNLLLSDWAAARSKPELRIDNDDVSCSHGATIGRIDERELFYLKSRGLSEHDAKMLLVYGFAHEILEEIQPPAVRSRLEHLIPACASMALGAA